MALLCLPLATLRAAAGDIVENEYFALKLPPGWKVEEVEPRVKLVGPRGERAQLAAYTQASDAHPNDPRPWRSRRIENFKAVMQSLAGELEMKVTQRPPERDHQSAYSTFLYMFQQARSTDNRRYLNTYALVGESVALLVVVNGAVSNISAGAMLEFYLRTTLRLKEKIPGSE